MELEKVIRECSEINSKEFRCAYILCDKMSTARMIADKAKVLGLEIPYPISMPEYEQRRRGTFITDFIVYDSESVLKYLLRNYC